MVKRILTIRTPAYGGRVNDADVWFERARHSWRILTSRSVRGRGRFLRVREPHGRRRVALWPLSQVLWAASVISAAAASPMASVGQTGRADAGPDLWRTLRWYRRDDAYLDNRPRGQHYFDDNAWLALVAAQQAQFTGEDKWWRRAMAGAQFLEGGCTADGGVRWVRGGATVNACSTGAAGLLFAVLAAAPAEFDPALRRRLTERADDAAQFLHRRLLRSDGLLSDHVRADGSVEPSVWSYNQGLAVALFDRTGHVAWADEVVGAVAAGLPPEVRHRQPAAFTCIWYRTLLARHANGEPSGLREYLEQAWEHGRNERGLFARVDRYDDGLLIDHAALTGLMAAYAAPGEVRAALL